MESPGSSSALQHWLERLSAGDPAARNGLIRHAQERLRRLTRQMLRRFPDVRHWEQTSDVFQNVLLRLDRALRDVSLPTALDFLNLAAVLIRRELIDLARRYFGPHGLGANQEPPGQDGAAPPEPTDSSGDPQKLALWYELHCQIAALPAEDRELFELLYYQGLTQAAAAEVLNISLRTLKRRWQGARLRLMERFGNDLAF
jgi:RNA polymerase sigma-70 factor (ECF subfamily)